MFFVLFTANLLEYRLPLNMTCLNSFAILRTKWQNTHFTGDLRGHSCLLHGCNTAIVNHSYSKHWRKLLSSVGIRWIDAHIEWFLFCNIYKCMDWSKNIGKLSKSSTLNLTVICWKLLEGTAIVVRWIKDYNITVTKPDYTAPHERPTVLSRPILNPFV